MNLTKRLCRRVLGRRRRASTSVTFFGVLFAIFLFAMFFIQILQVYDVQYAIEVRAQRAVNSAAEKAMVDNSRADGFNYMDVNEARRSLEQFLKEDLKIDGSGNHYTDGGTKLYHCSYSIAGASMSSGGPSSYAGISIPIHIEIYGRIMGQYTKIFNYTQTFESRNFRTDKDYRAGWRI